MLDRHRVDWQTSFMSAAREKPSEKSSFAYCKIYSPPAATMGKHDAAKTSCPPPHDETCSHKRLKTISNDIETPSLADRLSQARMLRARATTPQLLTRFSPCSSLSLMILTYIQKNGWMLVCFLLHCCCNKTRMTLQTKQHYYSTSFGTRISVSTVETSTHTIP